MVELRDDLRTRSRDVSTNDLARVEERKRLEN